MAFYFKDSPAPLNITYRRDGQDYAQESVIGVSCGNPKVSFTVTPLHTSESATAALRLLNSMCALPTATVDYSVKLDRRRKPWRRPAIWRCYKCGEHATHAAFQTAASVEEFQTADDGSLSFALHSEDVGTRFMGTRCDAHRGVP
jgi:hypothetical protein